MSRRFARKERMVLWLHELEEGLLKDFAYKKDVPITEWLRRKLISYAIVFGESSKVDEYLALYCEEVPNWVYAALERRKKRTNAKAPGKRDHPSSRSRPQREGRKVGKRGVGANQPEVSNAGSSTSGPNRSGSTS